MAHSVITDYSINKAAGTLRLPDIADLDIERIVSVFNVTRNEIIHELGTKSGISSINGNVITLNSSALEAIGNNNDVLQIIYNKPTASQNINSKFREAFESYAPNSGGRWTESLASGDIITLDGNAAAASYLVISKDPLSAVTESRIETVPTFEMPYDAALGLHMSQRTLGQEFSVEFVSDEPALAAPADVAISSITQATSTLTVNTTVPHNLRPGMRIGIRDCADSRMNYSALVVATTPTLSQFTATAGPGGTIPSVTAGPFTSGFVYFRSALGLAPNGTSMIFENATATNASFYVRSESGDVLPSGVTVGNHSITTLTTASVQAINAALTYAFQPTNEFRLSAFINGIQWSDAVVDTLAAANNRQKRTQVVPDIALNYRLRIRATNNASFTRPVAQIVSAAKTGTTTATVITATPHGLTTGDVINAYGTRDQTNFANLTAATAVASVVNATTFTVVWGSAVTSTTFGGYVSRVNGGQTQQGAVTQVVQSASVTNGILTLVGSATWSGIVIGDFVNAIGVRDITTGATLELDGAYRVRDIQTTSLILEPVGTTPTPATLVSTNCGGAIIRRTDFRLSFIRILDFERQRVELLARPAGDIAEAAPVSVQNTPAVTMTSTTVSGTAAIDAAIANPVAAGLRASNANIAAMSAAGDVVGWLATMIGAGVVKPYALPESEWAFTSALTATTDVQVQAAAGTGIKRHVTCLQATNTGAAAVDVLLRDGTTTRLQVTVPAGQSIELPLPTGIPTTANTILNVALSAAGTVRVNILGYTAP